MKNILSVLNRFSYNQDRFFDDTEVQNVEKITPANEREAWDKVDADESATDENTDGKDESAKDDENQEATEEGTEDSDEVDEDNKEDTEEKEENDTEVLDDETTYQALKKIDKDIFKKVPGLRSTIFREQEYAKIFPSIDDAQQANESAEVFANFQRDIESGTPDSLLEAVKEMGTSNLTDFAGNFMPALEKLDREVYLQVLTPELKKVLRVASKSPDERISKAAANIHYFLFQHMDLDKEEGYQPRKKDEREEKLSKREQEIEQRQFQSFANDIGNTASSRVKNRISAAFKDSDISTLSQKHLTQEIYARLEEELSSDKRHKASMSALWQKAKNAGFTPEWKDRIISAYLSRASVAIPKHRQKVLEEAKVSAKAKTGGKEKVQPTRITGTNTDGKGNRKGPIDPKTIDWNKTSDRDVLEGKITLKKS